MRYNFSEKTLGSDFCKTTVEEIKSAIQKGASSTILGIPLVGMVTFCRYLATTNIAYFAYIDAQSLKYRTRNELFLSLYNELGGKNMQNASINAFESCKMQLRKLSTSHERIAILIARLDYLKESLGLGLLSDFKTLADISVGKIVFIGSSRLPLYQINASALNNNPSFIIDPIYFAPHNKKDFKKLINFLPGGKNVSPKDIKKNFDLSAGHICLMWQLLKSEYLDNPLADEIIKIHLQKIYDAYSLNQKFQLRKIAAGKTVKDLDPFLLKIGLVKRKEDKYELFTPLLRDYILTYIKPKLPKKERKLLALLKSKLGKLVTKDELFQTLWDEKAHEATDWALNSTIYRLRKHPFFQAKGYVIENEKNEGYRMIKES